tara:strand:+ start:1167 stop:1568 length:402 start_codon:yes stop_codon:yes gene_type:complete
MAAGIYSFTIEQGATTDFEVTYKDSTDTPVDLTGYKARMQIRPSIGSSEIYLTLSSSLGPCGTGLNLSGSNGITPLASGSIGIFISAISSSQLDFDSAKYDLEIASGSGNCAVVTRLLQGNVKLSKEVTQGSY